MITLNAVTLNPSLQWTNKRSSTPLVQASKRTIGGVQLVFTSVKTAGTPIILEATEDTGWFDYSMVESIIAMADTLGGQYSFSFFNETYSVIFDIEAGAYEFQQLQSKQEFVADDKFIGTIRLLTI